MVLLTALFFSWANASYSYSVKHWTGQTVEFPLKGYQAVYRVCHLKLSWNWWIMVLSVTFLVSVSFGLAASSSSILKDFSTLTSLLGCNGRFWFIVWLTIAFLFDFQFTASWQMFTHNYLVCGWMMSWHKLLLWKMTRREDGRRRDPCERRAAIKWAFHRGSYGQEAAVKVQIVNSCFNKMCYWWWKKRHGKSCCVLTQPCVCEWEWAWQRVSGGRWQVTESRACGISMWLI